MDETPLRVWIDDHNPIFRLGLVSCLDPAGLILAGESAGLCPEPALAGVDILVFELTGSSLPAALRLSDGPPAASPSAPVPSAPASAGAPRSAPSAGAPRSAPSAGTPRSAPSAGTPRSAPSAGTPRAPGTKLVAVAQSATDDLLVEAVEAGVTGVLVRGEVNPTAFLHCLRSVAAGNGSLPTAVLGRLVSGVSGPRAGARLSVDGLTERELGVLRLLSVGESTRQIADGLCYSEKTVKNIVHDVLVRMNCRNRAQAVALATRRGLI